MFSAIMTIRTPCGWEGNRVLLYLTIATPSSPVLQCRHWRHARTTSTPSDWEGNRGVCWAIMTTMKTASGISTSRNTPTTITSISVVELPSGRPRRLSEPGPDPFLYVLRPFRNTFTSQYCVEIVQRIRLVFGIDSCTVWMEIRVSSK